MVTNNDIKQARDIVTLIIAVGRQIVQPYEAIGDSVLRADAAAEGLASRGYLIPFVEAIKS